MQVRKTILLVLIGLLIFSAKVFASSDSDYMSMYPGQVGKGFFNGRSWSLMSEISKTMYMVGLQEGIQMVAMQLEIDVRAKLANKLVCGLKTAEIVELLDNFYADTYNLRLPIVVAYSLIVFKANGGTTKEFEKRLSGLRKIWK